MTSSGEPARFDLCATCGGEGGSGDERCAMVICPDCDGSGMERAGAGSERQPSTGGNG